MLTEKKIYLPKEAVSAKKVYRPKFLFWPKFRLRCFGQKTVSFAHYTALALFPAFIGERKLFVVAVCDIVL